MEPIADTAKQRCLYGHVCNIGIQQSEYKFFISVVGEYYEKKNN